MQEGVNDMVEQLRVAVVVPPPLEAAFRLVPRSAFLTSHAVSTRPLPRTWMLLTFHVQFFTCILTVLAHDHLAACWLLRQHALGCFMRLCHQLNKCLGAEAHKACLRRTCGKCHHIVHR